MSVSPVENRTVNPQAVRHITPIGTVTGRPFLHTPVPYGKPLYRCDLLLSAEDAAPMVEQITAGMNANLRAARERATLPDIAARLVLGEKPFAFQKDGSVLFRFTRFPRSGTLKGPRLAGAAGEVLAPGEAFKNGARATVCYEETPRSNEKVGVCSFHLKIIEVRRFPSAESDKGRGFLESIAAVDDEKISGTFLTSRIAPGGDVVYRNVG